MRDTVGNERNMEMTKSEERRMEKIVKSVRGSGGTVEERKEDYK